MFACLYDPLFFLRLFFLIKKLKPDVIHSLLWSANVSSRIVARLLRIAHISAYHLDIYNDGVFRNAIDWATRRMSDCVVAVSNDVARSLGPQKNYKQLEVIKNGIDFNYLHMQASKSQVFRQELGLTDEHFIFGAVGRLHPQKNFTLLLRSFAQFCKERKNARLVIVGVGALEQVLKDLACHLGIDQKVRFVIGRKAYNYYQMFDCFVQSSIKEGLSIALLEAMSFGLPCIVTNSGAAHPVIQGGYNGIIVESKNQKDFHCAMIRVLDIRSQSILLGRAAKKSALEGFSVENMVSSYRSLFCLFANRI